MLRTSLFIAFTVIVSAAAFPYHHVIQTPTSRVEQRLVFSPRFRESYQVKKQDVAPFSSFQLPKQQVVYYYEHPQNGHLSVQLYGTRQDTPWWQDLWAQIMGQGQGQGEGEGESPTEETSESSELPIETNKIAEPLKDLLPPPNQPTELKHEAIKEEALVGDSDSTTQSTQVSLQENVMSDDLDSVRIDAAFRTATKQEPENNSAETTKAKVDSASKEDLAEKVETSSAAVSSTTFKLDEETSTTSVPLRADEVIFQSSQDFEQEAARFEEIHNQEPNNVVQANSCRNGKEAPSAMHHIYSIDNQYYVVSGSPKFYGNAEARSLMFSLQELQPVMRNDDYVVDDNAKLQNVASPSTTLQETSPAFMINVVDEDEASKKPDNNDEGEQISARSISPSDDQSVIVSNKKESHDEEKRRESSAEGESMGKEEINDLISFTWNHSESV